MCGEQGTVRDRREGSTVDRARDFKDVQLKKWRLTSSKPNLLRGVSRLEPRHGVGAEIQKQSAGRTAFSFREVPFGVV